MNILNFIILLLIFFTLPLSSKELKLLKTFKKKPKIFLVSKTKKRKLYLYQGGKLKGLAKVLKCKKKSCQDCKVKKGRKSF